MNKIFAVIALTLLSNFVFAGNWYEGGTLHKASVSTWKSAIDKNKLATAADWSLLSSTVKSAVQKSGNIDIAKVFAKELITCVDTAIKDVELSGEIGEIAATCMVLMGWIK